MFVFFSKSYSYNKTGSQKHRNKHNQIQTFYNTLLVIFNMVVCYFVNVSYIGICLLYLQKIIKRQHYIQKEKVKTTQHMYTSSLPKLPLIFIRSFQIVLGNQSFLLYSYVYPRLGFPKFPFIFIRPF